MSKSSHEETHHAEQGQPVKTRVPRSLFVLILLLLAGMYWYAAYGDTPPPEKTVQTFYQAYFAGDYETVADNLSVFWSVRFLPQYADLSPSELLAQRTQVVSDITGVISDIESQNAPPQGVKINIKKPYTKVGKTSAVVVYEFVEQGQPTSMEAAILIMEKGKYRIFNLSTVDESVLSDIKNLDMNVLDQNFDELLSSQPSAE